MNKGFSHIQDGLPSMVDIGQKAATSRRALAETLVKLPESIVAKKSGQEILSAKGPVCTTAIIAGTQAVKSTAQLIPFCHPLLLTSIHFKMFWPEEDLLAIRCEVKCHGPTGVEMEALTGVSVAALVVIDMCKAISSDIVILKTHLLEKTGGQSDYRSPA